MNSSNLTPEYINSLSYTDFVGLINQWNVLPGAYSSINKWAIFSGLNSQSYLLEVACTTGFSSRELSLLTGCKGVGIDISTKSIEKAKYNKEKYANNADLEYINIDGYEYKSNKRFTHIVVGAALRFFPDPQKMLNKCVDMLEDGGYILATEFYTPNGLPKDLVKEAEQIFNFTPTTIDYKKVMSIYRGLDIVYEERNDIYQETEDEIHHYCKSTIDRTVKELGSMDDSTYKAMYDRLYKIKDMSNRLRPYQKYNVLVLRYRKDIYPNRYVELF